MIRIISALLIVFSTTAALANEGDIYEVKKGEVWDWHDVLKKSPNYQRRYASLGVSDLVARLNGSPKLAPGTRIRLAPLGEMLRATKLFERWPDATVLLDARRFALKWAEAACTSGGPSGDVGSLDVDAKDIRPRLAKLVKRVPRRAGVQLRHLAELFDSARINREQRQRARAATCKNHIAILKRSGWALRELHRELAISSARTQ